MMSKEHEEVSKEVIAEDEKKNGRGNNKNTKEEMNNKIKDGKINTTINDNNNNNNNTNENNNNNEEFIKHVSGTNASFFSSLTFHYLTKLIQKVKSTMLTIDDIPPTEEKYVVKELLKSFDEANIYKENLTSFKLMKILFRMNYKIFVATFFLAFYYMVAQLTSPLMLRGIIISVGSNTSDGLYYAFGLYFCLVTGSLCNQHCQNFLYHVGNRQRATISALIFRSALSRSAASYSRDGVSIGAVVNLLSNDAQKLYDVMPTIHLLWSAPTQIIVATYLLISTLGSESLVGVGFLCLMAPVNFYIAKAIARMRDGHMPITDKRVELCSEIIEGIHSVKCFSWERKFYEKILQVRKGEVKYIRQELYAFANFIVLLISFPIVSLMLTFVTYVHLSDKPLSAANAFGTLALFNVLRFPLMELGQILSVCTQAFIALQRIANFIQQSNQAVDDFSKNNRGKDDDDDDIERNGDEEKIYINITANSTFMWTMKELATNQEQTKIQDDDDGKRKQDVENKMANIGGFSLTVKDEFICTRNDLIAIVGQVGSGKSLFVNSILGETYCLNGSIYVQNGVKSLVPQTAWILNRSVRNNILFDHDFNLDIYTKVLEACQLTVDIKSFAELDQTIIGERGVTLSGGQKQRVSLARAAYACLIGKSQMIIMDDPLSALDAHTAKYIFEKLIGPQSILKDVARILVTHATHFLPQCSHVFLTKDGTMSRVEHIQDTLKDITIELAKQQQDAGEEDTEDGEDITLQNRNSNASTTSVENDKANIEYMQSKKGKKLMTDENRERGSLNFNVVFRFVRLGGGRLWVSCLAMLFLLERGAYGTCDWWLSVWSSAEKAPPKNDPGFGWPAATSGDVSKWYSYVYICCVSVMIVFVFGRLNTFVMCICKAAEKVFEKLLYGVLRTDVNFFEVTPHGRITNRFNFDTEVIDSALFQRINGSVASTMWLLTGTVIMVSVSPFIFIILIPTMFLYLKLHKFYRTSCVELQRLDSATRSPIQASFFEALQGLNSIRAYHAETKFKSRTNVKIEESLAVVKVQATANRWLGVRLEFMCAHVSLFASITVWLSRGFLAPGLAGLAVFWSIQFTTSLTFNIINTTEAEAKLSSVERVLEYSDLPPEDAKSWFEDDKDVNNQIIPKEGDLEFKNVVFKYRPELEPVLKGISFKVKNGFRVGICGRTGAGKSTIANALFRLRELADGSILVNNVDLKNCALNQIRGNICAMIPQIPTLFSGTLRFNLDPFDEYTDNDIWNSLNAVRLNDIITTLAKQQGVVGSALNINIEHGGNNLSVGQRQLICFARTILTRPAVLLLDEATSSCDAETDDIIQTALRNEFSCTTLIIAHRLKTIMDSDMILVLDGGKVVEYDSPANLLKDPTSSFSLLCKSSKDSGMATE